MANDTRSIEEQRKAVELLNQAYESETKTVRKMMALERQLKDLRDLQTQGLGDQTEAMEQAQKELTELEGSHTSITRAIKEQTEALDKNTEAQERGSKAADNISKATATVVGSMTQLVGIMDQAYDTNMAQYNTWVGAEIAVRKYASTLQKMQVELRRGTGYTARYTQAFRRLQGSYEGLGLVNEDLTKNMIALSNEFSAFDSLSTRQRDSITMLAGEFQNFGVEAEDTARVMERMWYSFDLGASASQKVSKSLMLLRQETGRPLRSLVKDLNDLGPDLARFGTQGIQVFGELTKRARFLGLTVKDAFDFTEMFDTFEGAANVAGRLNAQLGLQLNSVEMMRMSSEERLDLLRQELHVKGLTWEGMGRRQRQMVAEILGKDVETTGKLFKRGLNMQAIAAEAGAAVDKQKFIEIDQQAKAVAQGIAESWLGQEGGFKAVQLALKAELEGIKTNTNSLTTAQKTKGMAEMGWDIAKKTLIGIGATVALVKMGPKKAWELAKAAGRTGADKATGGHWTKMMGEGAKQGTNVIKGTVTGAGREAAKRAGQEIAEETLEGVAKQAASGSAKTMAKRVPMIGSLLGVGINKASGQSWGRAIATGVVGGLASVATYGAVTAGTGGLGAIPAFAVAGGAGYAAEQATGAVYDSIFGAPAQQGASPGVQPGVQTGAGANIMPTRGGSGGGTVLEALTVPVSLEINGDYFADAVAKAVNVKLNPVGTN